MLLFDLHLQDRDGQATIIAMRMICKGEEVIFSACGISNLNLLIKIIFGTNAEFVEIHLKNIHYI